MPSDVDKTIAAVHMGDHGMLISAHAVELDNQSLHILWLQASRSAVRTRLTLRLDEKTSCTMCSEGPKREQPCLACLVANE